MPFDLERFVVAQEGVYDGALASSGAGRKTGHWIWFIFPQLVGLGRSEMSRFYGIESLDGGARLPRRSGPGAAVARMHRGACWRRRA